MRLLAVRNKGSTRFAPPRLGKEERRAFRPRKRDDHAPLLCEAGGRETRKAHWVEGMVTSVPFLTLLPWRGLLAHRGCHRSTMHARSACNTHNEVMGANSQGERVRGYIFVVGSSRHNAKLFAQWTGGRTAWCRHPRWPVAPSTRTSEATVLCWRLANKVCRSIDRRVSPPTQKNLVLFLYLYTCNWLLVSRAARGPGRRAGAGLGRPWAGA